MSTGQVGSLRIAIIFVARKELLKAIVEGTENNRK
jgi:hypothetical protein